MAVVASADVKNSLAIGNLHPNQNPMFFSSSTLNPPTIQPDDQSTVD